MLLEKMSREDLIELFKDQLVKCNQSISINKVKPYGFTAHFTKGYVYLFHQCEGGNYLTDDNDKIVDLDELQEIYHIDISKVFSGF